MDGETDPETLRDALDGDGDVPLIVDIRSPAHFEAEHIPGSENVPLPEIPQSIESIAEADHVVTVCPHGKASVKAARIVGAYREFDGRVESLAGGLEAWDGPLESNRADAEDPGPDGQDTGSGDATDSGENGREAPF